MPVIEHLMHEQVLSWADYLSIIELKESDWNVIDRIGIWDKKGGRNKKLTKVQCYCLYRYYWKKATCPQIALILGISKQTVLRHIYAAKKKLRLFLQNKKELI